jgi:alanine dehydrogenase
MRFTRDLDFGCVWVNTHIPLVAEMPHGGFKRSGYGKDLSMYGFEDYTRVKHVMHNIEVESHGRGRSGVAPGPRRPSYVVVIAFAPAGHLCHGRLDPALTERMINDDHRRTHRDQDRREPRGAHAAGRARADRRRSPGADRTRGRGRIVDRDADYVATGATIVDTADDVWAASELVCKVKEPIAEEYPRLAARAKARCSSPTCTSRRRKECTDALVKANNVAIAYETVRLADNSLPLLTPMSEVAGRMAPLMGAHHLMRPGGGRGSLIGGVPGVEAANVVVIGAGVSGLAAATMAVGLHANVKILDRNLDRLRQVDHHFDGRLETIASSTHAVEEACLEADIVIGAVLVVGAKAPKLVSNALVAEMRPGSVLVDISVDQGGCFEATHPTTHSDPVFEVNGSIFYCVANMPGAVPVHVDLRAGQRDVALHDGTGPPGLARRRRSSRRRAGRRGQRRARRRHLRSRRRGPITMAP